MSLLEATLRSESALAIREIARFYQQLSADIPYFYLQVRLSTATMLFYTAYTTFSIADAFARVQSDEELSYTVTYTISVQQLPKLQQILNSSPIYPLLLVAHAGRIVFKRYVQHLQYKLQFFTFLSVDFPVLETMENRDDKTVFEHLYAVQKQEDLGSIGDFNDITAIPAFYQERVILLFSTRFQQAEQLFKALQLDRNLVLSLEIADYVDFNQLRPRVRARTSDTQFIHPKKIAGSVRAAWITENQDCWLLNQVQIHIARTLTAQNSDKKQATPKNTLVYQKIIESAPFASFAVHLGRQPLIYQFCQIYSAAILGLAFQPEIEQLYQKLSEPDDLKFLAPSGILYLQRKFCNCTGILRMSGLRSEICYLCGSRDESPTQGQMNMMLATDGLSPGGNVSVPQFTPVKQTSPNAAGLHQTPEYFLPPYLQFSEFKSQDMKFAMKFSAGQNVQFPIFKTKGSPNPNSALDLSGLRQSQANISSIQQYHAGSAQLLESSGRRAEIFIEDDILSIINEDSGVDW